MTGSDRPFRRPYSGTECEPSDDESSSENPGVNNDAPKPLILDPELHQSVWKPWEGPGVDSAAGREEDTPAAGPPAATSLRLTRRKRVVWMMAGALAVVLIVALLIPSITRQPFAVAQPLVMSLPTQPTMSWTAEGGNQCARSFSEDHMIMSDDHRVWSLDLRSGETKWSVSFPMRIRSSVCLPGAKLVSVTEASAWGKAFDITLLDATSGKTVTVLPSTSTVQVIPLGNGIGLVNPQNALSMVERGRLNSPLWTHELSWPTVGASPIHVQPLDDTTVSLIWNFQSSAYHDPIVLSLDDGEVPGWVDEQGFPSTWYVPLGPVIVRFDTGMSSESVKALDRDGRELWSKDSSVPIIIGSHLYLGQRTSRGTLLDLKEVNPETGSPVDDLVFTGDFNHALGTPDDRVVIQDSEALILLDEHLKPAETFPSEDFRFWFQGEEQMFLGVGNDVTVLDEKLRVSAISRDDSSVLWTLDLQDGQSVEQMGKYLIVTDRDNNTIHGLRSR